MNGPACAVVGAQGLIAAARHTPAAGAVVWIVGAAVLAFDVVWGIAMYTTARTDLDRIKRWGRPVAIVVLLVGVVLIAAGIAVQTATGP